MKIIVSNVIAWMMFAVSVQTCTAVARSWLFLFKFRQKLKICVRNLQLYHFDAKFTQKSGGTLLCIDIFFCDEDMHKNHCRKMSEN